MTRWSVKSIGRCSRTAFAGFTLVELLVVIAIIGILVGLLLPAVQAAREAARRCQCSNNLAQAGLAVHHFEFNNEHLPSGVTNPAGPVRSEPQGQHVSWIVRILPYIEQSTIFKHFDQDAGAYAPANLPARRQPLSILACPSQAHPDALKIDGSIIYGSDYAGVHHDSEAPIDSNNNGLLFLNSRVRFGEIEDGSSNTLLVGEKLSEVQGLGWASGTRATLRNTGSQLESPKNLAVVPAAQVNALTVGGFGSAHTGGAQFVLADGSVRFLSSSIDAKLYRRLGHRADGELMDGQEWW
jgi:prepilin-type N-terminal cleavage/methylation domain-containing protein